VSALDFLSVDGADGGVAAVSAIARAQRDLGATFEERDGWLVPVSLPDEGEHLAAAGVADLSHLTKLEVRPGGDAPDFATDCCKVWYAISPRRALALAEARDAAALREQLAARKLVLDVTGAWSLIALAGPEATTVLRRMTHIHHFPSGGEIAHVQGHVLERDGAYWILVAQEYGEYVWEVAVDRASVLGGGPVGVDSL